MSLTVLIDYESGNLHSAHKAFERMAREADAGTIVVSSDADVVARADRIVLPGDGAYPACAAALRGTGGLYDALVDVVENKGRPFLGICVGMQLMASWGREFSDTEGLDWVAGEVVPITPADPALKVPHMGWNDLILDAEHPVFAGTQSGDHVYFVHSYHFAVAEPSSCLAHVEYGGNVTAVVGRDTMLGMQFHPEKSQDVGLRMIRNFLTWAP
jgi:imidazole glycerol-phosphate synthase subunit HisH